MSQASQALGRIHVLVKAGARITTAAQLTAQAMNARFARVHGSAQMVFDDGSSIALRASPPCHTTPEDHGPRSPSFI